MDNARQRGKIERVESGFEDHGILTSYVFLDFGGSGQGFGGLCLGNSKTDRKLLEDYEASLCATFGVERIEDLVGKECFALRSFGHWNEQIVGLEALDGRRFTINAWRRRHWPDTKDPLDEHMERLRASIEQTKRRQAELEQELATVRGRYRAW